MKKYIALILTVLLLTSCNSDKIPNNTEHAETAYTQNTQPTDIGSLGTAQEAVTNVPETEPVKNDSVQIAEKNAEIYLDHTSVKVDGDGVAVNGTVVTVNAPGTYVISGVLDDGQIRVEVDKSSEVTLILNGASVTCKSSAPVYVLSADKTTVELCDGSVNILTDGEVYTDQNSEAEPNAALFSKDDLTLKGSGSLTVNGNFNNGITSKNDLKIKDGKINVTAKHDGIRGKDSVQISGGQLTVNAEGDGIKAYETETDGKGDIIITGGQINITAGQDGIQTDKNCEISNAAVTLKTGGGSQNSSDGGGSVDRIDWGGPLFGDYEDETDDPSAKGIKAAVSLKIMSGDIIIDSSDDSLHSNGAVTVEGGKQVLSSGDDGVHADETVTVSGGQLDIKRSYEGIEGKIINISGGVINIKASDDGLNAAGGNDGSGMGGRPGMDGFGQGSGEVNISGGQLYMDAEGDGLDSNGNINMTGGTVFVDGPQSGGNGALDYNASFAVSGGSLVAVGSVGMAQNISDGTQCSVLIAVSGNIGDKVEIKDKNGNTVLSHTPAKRYDCVVFSHPDLKQGEEYTVTVNGAQAQSFTFSQKIMSVGVNGGFGGGQGGWGFGGGGRPPRH